MDRRSQVVVEREEHAMVSEQVAVPGREVNGLKRLRVAWIRAGATDTARQKGVLSLLLGVSLLITAAGASAMQTTVLEKRNEYGGRTEEERYSTEDARYREGLAKLVLYFDGNDRIIKLESFLNDRHAGMDGVERTVQYFDNRFLRRAVRTRVEFHYSDAYAGSEGLAKAVEYYDEAGKRTKIDYFYTGAYARKRQAARLEVVYDPNGQMVKRTYRDRGGQVLATESRQ